MAYLPGAGLMPRQDVVFYHQGAGQALGNQKVSEGIRGGAGAEHLPAEGPHPGVVINPHRQGEEAGKVLNKGAAHPIAVEGGADDPLLVFDEARDAHPHPKEPFLPDAGALDQLPDALGHKGGHLQVLGGGGLQGQAGADPSPQVGEAEKGLVGTQLHPHGVPGRSVKVQQLKPPPAGGGAAGGGVFHQQPFPQHLSHVGGDGGEGKPQLVGDVLPGHRGLTVDYPLDLLAVSLLDAQKADALSFGHGDLPFS